MIHIKYYFKKFLSQTAAELATSLYGAQKFGELDAICNELEKKKKESKEMH